MNNCNSHKNCTEDVVLTSDIQIIEKGNNLGELPLLEEGVNPNDLTIEVLTKDGESKRANLGDYIVENPEINFLKKGANDDIARVVMNGDLTIPAIETKKKIILFDGQQAVAFGLVQLNIEWSRINLLNSILRPRLITEIGSYFNPTKIDAKIITTFKSSTLGDAIYEYNLAFIGQNNNFGLKDSENNYIDFGDYKNLQNESGSIIVNFQQMFGSDSFGDETQMKVELEFIDDSQTFVQKNNWDAPTVTSGVKLLGLDGNGNFVTIMM